MLNKQIPLMVVFVDYCVMMNVMRNDCVTSVMIYSYVYHDAEVSLLDALTTNDDVLQYDYHPLHVL